MKSDHNIVLFFKRRGVDCIKYVGRKINQTSSMGFAASVDVGVDRIKYVGRKINQTSSMGFAASVDNFRSIGVVGQNKETLKIVGGSKTGL